MKTITRKQARKMANGEPWGLWQARMIDPETGHEIRESHIDAWAYIHGSRTSTRGPVQMRRRGGEWVAVGP